MTNEQIAEFWRWFVAHADEIAAIRAGDEPIADELDRRLGELGWFTWEIGPGLERDRQLAISPCGDADALPATRAIVAAAPVLEGWEFHPAKQPRPGWTLEFEMRAANGVFVDVDASRWRFAYDRADRTLAIEAANLDGLSDDDKIRAVEIALDGVIGEELRLIGYDELVVAEELDDDEEARPLAALREAMFDA